MYFSYFFRYSFLSDGFSALMRDRIHMNMQKKINIHWSFLRAFQFVELVCVRVCVFFKFVQKKRLLHKM